MCITFQCTLTVIVDNPMTDEELYRIEVLIAFDLQTSLERLDKESFVVDELEEATEIYQERKEEVSLEMGQLLPDIVLCGKG